MEFVASIEHLHHILQWIQKQLGPAGFDRKVLHHVEVASEEALVNIIHHAYQDLPGKIDVQVRLFENQAEIVFVDHGPPFNPLDAEPVDPNLPLEEREIGGLGIHFIRKCVDLVHYERKHEKNVLTFIIQKK
ncbi:MAG: ATP-binding protein [Parachlamydiales bacterium]|nr:ATP-binding protein [Parachlamydiales bacterium]